MKYLIIVLVVVVLVLLLSKLTLRQAKTNYDETPYSGILKKINVQEYTRFILIHKSPKTHILKKIKEFGELPGEDDMGSFNFNFAINGDWTIIEIENNLSFHAHHNLTTWFLGYEENVNNPDGVFGIAQNREEPLETYYFYLDPSIESGDTEIGIFENGERFFVYLPGANVKYGNLTVSDDVKTDLEVIKASLNHLDFDLKILDSLEYQQETVILNEDYRVW